MNAATGADRSIAELHMISTGLGSFLKAISARLSDLNKSRELLLRRRFFVSEDPRKGRMKLETQHP